MKQKDEILTLSCQNSVVGNSDNNTDETKKSKYWEAKS